MSDFVSMDRYDRLVFEAMAAARTDPDGAALRLSDQLDLRTAVETTMLCPLTREILDITTAWMILWVEPRKDMSGPFAPSVRDQFPDVVERLAARRRQRLPDGASLEYRVLDGRELFAEEPK